MSFFLAIVFSISAHAANYKGPGYVLEEDQKFWSSLNETEKKAENQAIFETYCIGKAASTEVPGVNYQDPLVKKAAKVLSGIEYNAFYFYSGPASAYGLKRKNFDVYHDYAKNIFIWVEVGAKTPEDIEKGLANGSLEKLSESKKSMLFDPRPDSKPKNVTDPAHVFLVQLCGEFRDRATLIREKLEWVSRTVKLPAEEQAAFNPKKDLWSQMSAQSYRAFLDATAAVWNMKKMVLIRNRTAAAEGKEPFFVDTDGSLLLNQGDSIKIGEESADTPVSAMTICETKYAFAEYAIGDKEINSHSRLRESIDQYAAGFKAFSEKNCSNDDLAYYYDYRGDSNLKHYTPESNGMIWHASSVAGNCLNTTTAKTDSSGNKKVTDEECEAYFKAPFKSRWTAARAGIGSWLFYNEAKEENFRNDSSPVVIFPYDENKVTVNPLERPYSYGFTMTSNPFGFLEAFSELWTNIKNAWSKSDAGLMAFAKFGPQASENDKYFIFNRLRNSVNRHTNWYQSGFVDGRGMSRNQAYSPMVASSYEPHESDSFTAPGYTVAGDADGRKYWMYVFRVPVQNLVTSTSIAEGKVFDLDTAWFDETSLGDTELADREKAFDRLGTVLEGEYDSILYLHNIIHEGDVEEDHGVPLVYEK